MSIFFLISKALPSLPPLTPLSKLQTIQKTPTIEQQQLHAIQYRNATHSSASLNLPKNHSISRNVRYLTEEDGVNLIQSNIQLVRQTSKEQMMAPKKNLPHKKRITKKLKSISPNSDQMHTAETAYQTHHDIIHLQRHHEQTFSISNHQQNETLNLALNQQPIQLTTSRVNHLNQATNQNRTEFMTSDHYSDPHTNATNVIHSVQLQHMPEAIDESHSTIHIARFTCEICGIQSQTQLGFFNHLKLHYECKLETSVRNNLEQCNQNIFEMNNERKMATNQCMSDQSMNQPVIMTDNFLRLQNSCISNIGNEDVTDDESMNGYNDTVLNGIKSEQNEFSDPEDMIENGVLDKVQRVVDSYLENGTSDVKNLIDMNENQHHSSLVDNSCNWTDNSHALSNNSVFNIEKNESVTANNFVITSNHQNKEPTQAALNHIISSQPVERPEELALIYEINVNDKDFSIMDDTSTESGYIAYTRN